MKRACVAAAAILLLAIPSAGAQESASSSEILTTAQETAASVHGVVEEWSKKAVIWLEAQQRRLERELEELAFEDSQRVNDEKRTAINDAAGVEIATSVERGPSVNSSFERLWKNLLLLLIKLAIFILQHAWLLYTVLIVIALRIIFGIFRFFRSE